MGLVLCPTRELALQIDGVAKDRGTIYLSLSLSIYIYIYIYVERERHIHILQRYYHMACVHVCIYVYIYTYIYIYIHTYVYMYRDMYSLCVVMLYHKIDSVAKDRGRLSSLLTQL